MNSKLLYGAALSTIMLTACSQDSIIDSPENNPDVISYAVTNGATSRAMQSTCNTSMPASFLVSANIAGTDENYFSADKVNKADNSVNTYTPEIQRYWPVGKSLDFYAWTNDDQTHQANENGHQFVNFSPEASASQQLDLIYAVAKDQKAGSSVKLNFRHALSQIVFAARNETRLNVSIKGVEIVHLNTVGTYTFGSASTADNYENHEENLDVEDNRKGLGEWTGVATSPLSEYSTSFAALDITSTTVDLTTADHQGNPDGSLILLPQEQPKWTPGGETGAPKYNGYNGAYFSIDLTMIDGNTTIYAGKALVPVEISWEQGKRYKYTFVFEEGGNGGFLPGDPDNPTPVLQGISYEVTADDFVPVENQDVPVNGEENGGGTVTPEENSYSVTISNEGQTLFNQSVKSTEDSYTFNIDPAVENPVKDHYTFMGWSCSDGKTYQNIPSSVTVTKENPSLTFTAVWKEDAKYTYTLSYVAINLSSDPESNPVTNMPTPQTVTVTSYDPEYTFTVSSTVPVHGKREFQGWCTTNDINMDTPKLQGGATVKVTSSSPSATLYTAWGTPFIGGSTPGATGGGY